MKNTVAPTVTFLFSISLVACSTVAEPLETTTGGNPPVVFTDDGEFVKCGEGLYTCMPKFGVECAEHNQNVLYMTATCASTFNGQLDDYPVVHRYEASVLDWPQPSQHSFLSCEVGFDYTTTTESVTITNRVAIPGTDTYDIDNLTRDCGWQSYCELINAIDQSNIEVDEDPICNVDIGVTGGDTDGNGLLGPWRCIGSSNVACGEAELDGDPLPAICPVSNDATPNTDVCVLAIDEEDASAKCKDQCDAMNGAYALKDMKEALYEVTDPLDCTVYDVPDMEWVENPDIECEHGYVYPGLIDPTPFDFTAALVTQSGGSAASSGHYGFLDFTVDNCTSGECDIVINGISLPYDLYTGTFSTPVAPPVDYSVSGIHLHLLKPVRGVVDEVSERVYFPYDAFHIILSTGAVTLDASPISPIEKTAFVIDQVVGNYRSGILTLNITYNTIDADMSVTITTN